MKERNNTWVGNSENDFINLIDGEDQVIAVNPKKSNLNHQRGIKFLQVLVQYSMRSLPETSGKRFINVLQTSRA